MEGILSKLSGSYLEWARASMVIVKDMIDVLRHCVQGEGSWCIEASLFLFTTYLSARCDVLACFCVRLWYFTV